MGYFKPQVLFQCTLMINLCQSEWIIASTLLPKLIIDSPVGFYNGDIYFIDGDYNQNTTHFYKEMIKYSISNDKFSNSTEIYNESDSSASIFNGDSGFWDRMVSYSYWTQSDNLLYSVNILERLDVYDMNSNVFYTNWMNVSHPHDMEWGCLASTTQYLFSVGVYVNQTNYGVSMLDLSTYQWTDVPSMQSQRRELTCIIDSNNMLYAIGGSNGGGNPGILLSSIERISINSIQSQTWQYIDNLTDPVRSMRSVIYNAFIFVVGGQGYPLYTTYLDTVHVIDALTGSVSLLPDTLPWPVFHHSPIVVDGILYAFAGVNVGKNWTYTILTNMKMQNTSAPTTSMPTAITSMPTTSMPTTSIPTTSIPTTSMPTTSIPTTSIPTTSMPTTS
eukprot:378279_1